MGFQLPDLPTSISDPAVKEFLEKYYEVSNTSHAHDDYTALFTSDGEFSMNGKKAKGSQEIRALRAAIWSHVPNRDHKPVTIYTHGADQLHLAVHGTVAYKHHHGHDTASEWAAIIDLVREGEGDGAEVKVARYHIIVDSAAHV